MIYTINLAHLPESRTVDFLLWVFKNQIGNYQELYRFIAQDETWYLKEHIPFECNEKEAMLVMLRWT